MTTFNRVNFQSRNSVNEQRLRSTATATASSAYDSQRAAAARHYDKQREQTSAATVDCFQLSLSASLCSFCHITIFRCDYFATALLSGCQVLSQVCSLLAELVLLLSFNTTSECARTPHSLRPRILHSKFHVPLQTCIVRM